MDEIVVVNDLSTVHGIAGHPLLFQKNDNSLEKGTPIFAVYRLELVEGLV